MMLTTMTPAPRYRGLRNDSATCYLNSLLQTLYMTPELRTQLYQMTSSANKGSLLRELQLLFARLQLRTDRKAINTTSPMQSFGWTPSDLLQQHDVHELYHVLFKALDASLQGSPNANLVKDLYQCTLTDSVQCITCSHEASHDDAFLDLSLAIPSTPTSLDDAIATFLAPERLVSDNQWLCDVCGTKQDAIKRLSLVQLPPLLTLHLKRFAWDHGTSKLTSRVSFPKYLDMNAHHASTSSRPKVPPSSTTTQEAATEASWHPSFDLAAMLATQGPFVYELASVLVHAGAANGGHYVAYIQASLDDDRHWLCFNDASVSTISDAKLRTAYGVVSANCGYYESTRAPCAYVLQYRHVDVSRIMKCSLDDNMVPSWLVDLVQAEMQREQANKQARVERLRIQPPKKKVVHAIDMIELILFHGISRKKLLVSKHATLAEVTAQAVSLYALDIPLDRIRLRAHCLYHLVPRETYDGREHCTLADLSITPYWRFYMETRASSGEPWAGYDPTALTLKLRQYVPSTPTTPEHFTEPPVYVQIAGDACFEAFLSLVCATYRTNRDCTRVIKMYAVGYESITASVLNPTNDRTQQTLRPDLGVYDGANIYVEEVADLASSPSCAQELFARETHTITLDITTDEEPLLKRVKGNEMVWPFRVDRRQPLRVLKDQLGAFFELRPESFKLRRGAKNGHELKALDTSMANLSLDNRGTLYVELGAALRAGEYRVKIFLYTPLSVAKWASAVLLPSWLHDNELSFCTDLVVRSETRVGEMKTAIRAILKATHPRAMYLRLRDVLVHRRLLAVYADDDATLDEAYDYQTFAVQILDAPEALLASHKLFSLVLFDRGANAFGPSVELSVPTGDVMAGGLHWMDYLVREIQTTFMIPPDAIRFAKPRHADGVNLIDLQMDNSPKVTWIDCHQGRCLDSTAKLSPYSDRVVVADARVPAKVLSRDEYIALQARIDMASDVYTQLVGVGWSSTNTTVEIASSTAHKAKATALVLGAH
ncbi:hypothetical protein SPRG_15567 [Saprolegnia parasitica CBS 223.65]|uniref:USP domain-containing protein n=1 Tax=Saprolegnia parasitica (strain CBS 223.65) TaxID=695850 RepID=A0A067BW10_SAPPC|nr:hypothetical protein SPRG_15567 [Saprolegnia parasitica CBS 223.65]KDO18777.1 hypothetical protein SPRG_15567 [Saprolegnia parasitica CBS 223.65]|eukprot:XP_012210523.1 hypothetical protein SPRG_15567 [Saprolegnia parasitica CBS 223.65]